MPSDALAIASRPGKGIGIILPLAPPLLLAGSVILIDPKLDLDRKPSHG